MMYKRIENYQIGFELGKGTFFAVKDKQNYCIKITQITNPNQKDKTKTEIRAMCKLNGHENIISLKDTFQFQDNKNLFYGFAIELMPLNLRQYLDLKKENIRPSYLKEICKQLALGIAFMHDKFIVHNDLKLENVMLDPETNRVKIIDFGLSNVLESEEEMHLLHRVRGTPLYFPPEKVNNLVPFSGVYADIWSYGVLVFRLACGFFPFYQSTMESLMNSILEDDLSFPPKTNDAFKSLLSSILIKDPPSNRSGIQQILMHKWFSNHQ